MITWLQKKRKYLIVTLWISGLSFIGAGFVGWGSYSFESGVLLEVGGEEITRSEVDRLARSLSDNTGVKNENVLKEAALQMLIQEKRYKDYLKRRGFRVLDGEVLASISRMEFLKGRSGVFDRAKYFETLKRAGITPRVFEDQVRNDIYKQYLSGFFDNPRVNDIEVEGVSKLYSRSLSIEYGVEEVSTTGDVPEEDIRRYYEVNMVEFKKEPEFALEYVKFSPLDPVPTDAELEEYYKNNKFSFTGLGSFERGLVEPRFREEKRRKAAQLEYLKLKKGKSSLKIHTGLVKDDGGLIPEGQLATLTQGEYNKPIFSKDAYYIVKLKRVVDNVRPYEEVREDIANKLLVSSNTKELVASYESGEHQLDPEKMDKELEGVDYRTSFGTFGLDVDSENALKLDLLSKSVGSQGYFYSPSMGGVVSYRIVDQKERELSGAERGELEGNLKSLKSRLYSNYFNKSLERRYK